MTSLAEELSVAGDTTLQRVLTGNIVLLVLVVASVVGAVLLVGSYRAINEVSNQTIHQASEGIVAQLDGVFGPIETKSEILQDWGEAGELPLGGDELEVFNDRVRPLLSRNEQFSALGLADADGEQYVFWQEGDSWVGRYIAERGEEKALYRRWNDRGVQIDEWSETIDDDAWQRPWYEGAMAAKPGEVHWSEPFLFFMTDEPGMTLSRRFEEPESERSRVLALGVSLEDISNHTTGMRPTEGGRGVVATSTGEVIGLPANPRYADEALIRDDALSSLSELDLPVVERAWEAWEAADRDVDIVETDSDEVGAIRAGFRQFELGDQELVVSTVIPRRDLTGVVDRQRNIAVGAGFIGIGFAVFLSMWLSGRYRRRMEEVYNDARQFGQYRLGEKLGVGGMGEVYRAEHGMLERPTAIKLLKPDLYNEKSIRRFEREVKLSCKLTHPNTVTIFDYGETDSGLFYYAMELIEGVTLDEFLDYTGRLEAGRVIYLMRQVCGALQEAHELGLVHREIKPSNIMVGNSGGLADRVTVLDFGLVKDVETPDDAQLTNQECLQGSPGFMAPEVILGKSADDPAVDIFAAGVVMYKLLCGVAPFDGDSPVEILMAQVDREPTPPSEVVGETVDPGLETIIMRCLAKKPAGRYASIGDVRQKLISCGAAGDWTLNEAIAWWKEYGDDVVPTMESPETFDGKKAFEMTMEMDDGDVTTTLDDAPPGIGLADTTATDDSTGESQS